MSSNCLNLEVSRKEFFKGPLEEFSYPFNPFENIEIRTKASKALVQLCKNSSNDEAIIIRILSKWFLSEIVNLVEFGKVVNRSKENRTSLLVPDRFRRTRGMLGNSSSVETLFSRAREGLKRDPFYKYLPKKLIREYQWNKGKESSTGVAYCINRSGLTLKHAILAKKKLKYFQIESFFSNNISIEKLSEKTDLSERIFEQGKVIIESLLKNNLQTQLNQFEIWSKHAVQFVSFHMHNLKDNENLPKELWTGCSGSSIWNRMLCEAIIQKGGSVVSHDHGFGDSQHEQFAFHFVELHSTSKFVTYNKTQADIKIENIESELMLGLKKPQIASIDEFLESQPVKKEGEITYKEKLKTLMYVPTALHGESSRLRPIFPDLVYADWQKKLLTFLSERENTQLIYKPHPEGKSRLPKGFAESFGFQTNTKRFEDIEEKIDAYIIDFISSSTTATILNSKCPVIFIDPGYPKLLPEAEELLKKRCFIIKGEFNEDNRFSIDWKKLDSYLNSDNFTFSYEFNENYYKNIST